MSNVVIKPIIDPDRIITLWEDLKKVPLVNTPAEFVMAKALAREYTTIEGLKDDEFCGFMIYFLLNDTLHPVALYMPNHAREFIKAFDNWCISLGVKRYYAATCHNPEAYARLLGMEYHYTAFKKEL